MDGTPARARAMHQPPFETPARTRDLTALPLFGQGLVASRLARRAVLAMLPSNDQQTALVACDSLDEVTRRGDGWRSAQAACEQLQRLRPTRETEAAIEGVRWANDSVGAAQGALDFPVDATVAASAERCFSAIAHDPRVTTLQLVIVMHSDIDLIAFACREANIRTYDALTDYVFERLAPCHALTLHEPRHSIEEDYR